MNYLSRLVNWIRSAPNRREINQLAEQCARVIRERDVAETYWRGLEKELRDVEFAENNARAQLCQLRVSQGDVRGRTGYSVCAFIPMEVVETMRLKLPVAVDNFTNVIAHELVRRALQGAFHVNSRGKVSALIFGHVTDGRDGHYEPCSALFDSVPIFQRATPRVITTPGTLTPKPDKWELASEPGYTFDASEEIRQRRAIRHGY